VVDVSKFGTVVKSGWGEYPTDDVAKEVDDNLIQRANLDRNPQVDETALHLAVYKEKVDFSKELIDAGAAVNIRDSFGMTPLHLAAMRGNLPLVKMLDVAGADFSIKDHRGRMPLDIARMNEHEKAANYFKGREYMDIAAVSQLITIASST
jgi:ankyrin repeat protein